MHLQTTEQESECSSILTDNSSSVVQSQMVMEYVPNKYDSFLAEFAVLRNDALIIITKYPQSAANIETVNIVSKPPSERVWELVLPKFPEYLSRIESMCNRKVSIPEENFEELETMDSCI